jgi:hypothetical protein
MKKKPAALDGRAVDPAKKFAHTIPFWLAPNEQEKIQKLTEKAGHKTPSEYYRAILASMEVSQ